MGWIGTGLVRAETDPARVLARLPSTSDDNIMRKCKDLSIQNPKSTCKTCP